MSKTKLIAVSGVCAAVSLLCIFLANYLGFLAFALAVIASVAVSIPMLIDVRNGIYSLLCYIASGVLGIFLGLSNIGYVMPIVVFAIPFALIKVFAESEKAMPDGSVRKKLAPVVKWIMFYVLAEIGLALTLTFMYLLTENAFKTLLENNVIYYLIALVQIAIPVYNVVVNGCIKLACSALKRTLKK